MAVATDFEAWLELADPDGYEEVYALYMAVLDVEEFGLYKCSKSENGDQWFITGNHIENKLMLSGDKARETFLSLIKSRYCDLEMEIESWYQYERNMAKTD